MRRREFVALVGGVAVGWPLAARAQQPAMPVVGFLGSASSKGFEDVTDAFRRGLNESGFAEGRNVVIEYRWADNHYDRLPALAADLVRRQVEVIIASGGNVSALAAKAATTTIPIVFTAVADPVSGGLVASMNRPGGNVTGVAALTSELDPKRLELLVRMAPAAGVIGALLNPRRPAADVQLRDVQAAALKAGRALVVSDVGPESDLAAIFANLVKSCVGAILIGADPLFRNHLTEIAGLAARYALPTIWQFREYAANGGLASYGPSGRILSPGWRLRGAYS